MFATILSAAKYTVTLDCRSEEMNSWYAFKSAMTWKPPGMETIERFRCLINILCNIRKRQKYFLHTARRENERTRVTVCRLPGKTPPIYAYPCYPLTSDNASPDTRSPPRKPLSASTPSPCRPQDNSREGPVSSAGCVRLGSEAR
jgi:hypothetical protein